MHLKYSRHRPTKYDFLTQYIDGTVKNCKSIPKSKNKSQQIMFFYFGILGHVLVTKIVIFFAEAIFEFL